MAVNKPNEWSELREWLAARIVYADLTDFAEADRGRLARALTAVMSALGDGPGGDRGDRGDSGDGGDSGAAVEVVRGELGRGGEARADDVLRTHLAIALAARTADVRGIGPDGALVVANARQWAECRELVEEIIALSPHPELIAFATGLRGRLVEARRWRWVEPDVWTAAVVGLAVLVLPFVGAAIGSAVVTVAGVAVGGALVFGFVMAHRRRGWAVDPGR
ncbi:hypothetical protein B0I31_101673 [Saccharothrix carnea]|uniref:Uncharacterized protein n=1 Tax=Saccharothrix carnea TaxID=1280637 RepID=A0A2P8IJ18_SACCR|nr:hypothetical protein [Saccharothrix carnea]PSL58455.1 hypothetical protein B0I31_101673 [Saccharothrix carnea]